MRYIQSESRKQTTLFPALLDDYISKDNPVRFIDAFVDGLDMRELSFTHAETKDVGRKPYDPSDLLKLYIYGYLNKIRSSRNLEKSTNRNVELMWLMRRLHPDFKTIADFRKDNTKAIKRVCKEFTLLCKKLDLFGGELIAIDGSKFSAVNHNNRSYSKTKLKAEIEKINTRINEYFAIMDKNDHDEKDVNNLTQEELNKKIEELNRRKDKYEDLSKQLEESGENQVNLTDPDSRMIKTPKGSDVCYNVQIATDSKHKLIATHEVTNDINDMKQLSNMAIKTKKALGVDKLEALGDTGYYNDKEIKRCYDENIECFIPKPNNSNNLKKGLYTKEDFIYDSENDCYICPAKQKLPYRYMSNRLGKELKYYKTTYCRKCKSKPKCTESKSDRRIVRWVHEDIIDNMRAKMQKDKSKYEQRKALVEHPFGTLKHWMNHGYFLMKGFEKVSAEMSLSVLTYNLKRVINILGVNELIKAVK